MCIAKSERGLCKGGLPSIAFPRELIHERRGYPYGPRSSERSTLWYDVWRKEAIRLSFTLREALHCEGLRLCRVVAGARGLDRRLAHVTVMEVPDITEWLKGDDLLLTSLYSLRNDPAARRRLIRDLADRGACALAVKTRRYVDSVPPEMVEEADQAGFPLLEIPRDITYLDIMNPLMRELLRDNSTSFVDLERDMRWLTEIAFSGAGLDLLLRSLASVLRQPLTFENDTIRWYGRLENRKISPLSAEDKHTLREIARLTPIQRDLDQETMECIAAPLVLHGILEGCLTLWPQEGHIEKRDYMLLERASALVALELMKQKTAMEVEQRYKSEFLGDVLAGRGDPDELISRGRVFRWNLDQDFCVAVISLLPRESETSAKGMRDRSSEGDIQGRLLSELARQIEDAVQQRVSGAAVGVRGNRVILLLPVTNVPQQDSQAEKKVDSSNESFLSNLLQDIQKHWTEFDLVAGLGRIYPGVQGIPVAYREACQASSFGADGRARRRITTFWDLGIYRLLTGFNPEEMSGFYRDTVGRLEVYDQKNHTNLIETLEAYFAHNGSLTSTSQALFIHVNTLKYRLGRVEALTGLNPYDSEDRLQLQLALKIRPLLA